MSLKSTGMWRLMTLVRTDVSEERIASIISMTRVGELGTMLAVNSNRSMLRSVIVCLRSVLRLLVTTSVIRISPILITLMMEVTRFSDTSVLTRATRRHIPEDGILRDVCCLFSCSDCGGVSRPLFRLSRCPLTIGGCLC
jgi:hypothetical protein